MAYVRGQERSEKEKAYQREWMRKYRERPGMREKNSKASRDYQKRNWETHGFYNDSRSAQKRGYEWELDLETHTQLRLGICAYCGAAPDPLNGVDRVDNTRGYVKENCTSACFTCNRAKGEQSLAEFTDWITRIYNNLGLG